MVGGGWSVLYGVGIANLRVRFLDGAGTKGRCSPIEEKPLTPALSHARRRGAAEEACLTVPGRGRHVKLS